MPALGQSILEPGKLRWRVIAAFLWHLLLTVAIGWTMTGIPVPIPRVPTVLCSQLIGFAAQLPLFSSRPSPLLSIGAKLPPRLGVAVARTFGAWTSLSCLISRGAAGLGLWLSAFLALCTITPTLWLAGLHAQVITFVFLETSHTRGLHVVTTPAVCRPRLSRLRQALPPIAARVGVTSMTAVVGVHTLCMLAQLVLRADLGTAWSSVPALAVAALIASSLWAAAAVLTRGILQEPLRFPEDLLYVGKAAGQEQVTLLIGRTISGARGAIMRALSIQSLMETADASTPVAMSLRANVFNDASGEAWLALAVPCLAQVDELSAVLQPDLAAAPKKQGSARWNEKPAAPRESNAQFASHQAAVLRSLLRANALSREATDAARTLCALCCAALDEDRSGIVQLVEPGLAEVASSLGRCLMRVKALQRACLSLPASSIAIGADASASWGGAGTTRPGDTVDGALRPLWCIEDTLRVCMGRLIDGYSRCSLEQAIRDSRILGPEDKQEALRVVAAATL